MKNSFESYLRNELNVLQNKNLYREPFTYNEKWLNLASNDYFNLKHNSKVLSLANKTATIYGTGSGASPLLSGYQVCHDELLKKLLCWKNKKYGMLFNTGYMANQALLKHLPSKNDLIIVDKLIHHSMAQALNRGHVKFKRYNHLDMNKLEELLDKNKKNYNNIFVATESVFSMDGDYPDMIKLIELKKKYNFILILDEAHGTGIFGNTGAGLAEEVGVQDDVDIIMGTFGKALAGMGAYILTNSSLTVDYLRNNAGEYIYSTFLSPHQVGVALATIDIIQKGNDKRQSLRKKSKWLRCKLSEVLKVETVLQTPIIPLILGEAKDVISLQSLCADKNILVGAIRPPTVPLGSSRIRISINSELSEDELDPFIKIVKEWSNK